MMNPEKYFAKWDISVAGNDRLQTPENAHEAPLRWLTVDRGYTRRLLRSGCVLICLKARTTPVGFDSRSK